MKFAKYYALITQFVIEMIALILLGLYIGEKLDPDGILNGILATIGGLLGITFFIIYIIRVGDKDERTKKDGDPDGEDGRDDGTEGGTEDSKGDDSEAKL